MQQPINEMQEPIPAPEVAPEAMAEAQSMPAAGNLLEETGGEVPQQGQEPSVDNLLNEQVDTEGAITEPSLEQLGAFVNGIPALQDPALPIDDITRDTLMPELFKLSGGDVNKANALVARYGEVVKKQLEAVQKQQDSTNQAMIKDARERFGTELKKVVRYANIGGREIFGEELWNTFKSIPAFANNPDILERLARRGRMVEEDNGVSRERSEFGRESGADVIHRMYGGIKV